MSQVLQLGPTHLSHPLQYIRVMSPMLVPSPSITALQGDPVIKPIIGELELQMHSIIARARQHD